MELIGTAGETSMRVALGNGRTVVVEFPPETICLRVKRLTFGIVVERTETGATWSPVYACRTTPTRWSSIDELLA